MADNDHKASQTVKSLSRLGPCHDPSVGVIRTSIEPAKLPRGAGVGHAIARLPDDALAPDHPPGAADVWRRLAGLAEACRGEDGPDLSSAGLRAEIASRPGRRVTAWIATLPGKGGAAAGLVTLVESLPAAGGSPRYSIGWLLVDPAERRLGLGSALVAAAVAEAVARGADRVTAETRSDWTGATAFWRRLSGGHGASDAAPQ